MRTSIFNKYADLPKEFREDLETLWSLPRKDRDALIPHVSAIYRTSTVGEKKVAMDKAVTGIGGNAAHLLRALKFLLYVHGEWNPVLDTPEGFIKDLAELRLIPSAKAKEAKEFFVDFLGEVQKDNQRRLEKMHASSVLASYVGCTTLVDFRAVIDKPYGTGLDDNLKNYNPTCVSFVPVILVKIRTDSGNPDCLAFQCQEDVLGSFIEELQAALKDLRAARKSLPGGEDR
jgi:hypothetical protein